MKIEYEVKILDINVGKFQKKLESLGAEYLGEEVQKRYVYDFNPVDPNKWIRLRQKGTKTTLTVKEIIDDSITGTKEVEIMVGDFEDTNSILKELGYIAKAFQENKRISYKLDGVEIEIDFWPMIPAYVEVEGQNENDVDKTLEKLGYSIDDTTSMNTNKVYDKYGIDLSSIKDLRF